MKTTTGLSRRDLLQMSLAATTTGFLTAGLNVSFSSTAQAQSVLTPAAALDELVAGNKRFTSDRLTHHEQDL